MDWFRTQGIIPTRMGTRIASAEMFNSGEDHPHAYGDKDCECIIDGYKLGSSPRVWGQVAQVSPDGAKFGIIPTRMGTSISGFLSRVPVKDHPHAYGDKLRQ